MRQQTGDPHPQARVKMTRVRRDSEHARSLAHIELLHDDEPELAEERRSTVVADAVKRVVDIVGAIALIVVLLPLLLTIAVAIRLDSRGPILFLHRRLGRNGRHFDCLKFRTMETDAEHRVFQDESLRHHYVSNHFKIPADLDPRITRIGRFLRRSSLDELPQLWNVLKGEMALVGPRPIVALEATHYGDKLDDLLSVRPGLTGTWAVSGRSKVGYPARVDIELDYIRKRSFLTDLGIIARTPWVVITQKGAV